MAQCEDTASRLGLKLGVIDAPLTAAAGRGGGGVVALTDNWMIKLQRAAVVAGNDRVCDCRGESRRVYISRCRPREDDGDRGGGGVISAIVMTRRRAMRRWRREERKKEEEEEKRRGADFADNHRKNIRLQPQQSSAASSPSAAAAAESGVGGRTSSSLLFCRSAVWLSGIRRRAQVQERARSQRAAATTRSVNRLPKFMHSSRGVGGLPCNQTLLFESVTRN